MYTRGLNLLEEKILFFIKSRRKSVIKIDDKRGKDYYNFL